MDITSDIASSILEKANPLSNLGGMLTGNSKKENENSFKEPLTKIIAPSFPPMAIQGPYFHPPIKVTVNQINKPSEKDLLNPYDIELENIKK